ncbi:hypothetical protein [Thioflexithrix psekupsensis]|uniref:Uncharacterized protein n=1 Tax=Thioflexithrix psekupsensis TaxID=1570016 RepID=A0A251X5P6_9GAMM|nr:hypothetical protein [Thioflexithrix psekupsensis]OUD12821.1 hypothetical protein TPSD3_12540 [Thioflexithrix psekupsensis]
MSFQDLQNQLQEIFRQNNFTQNARNRNLHVSRVEIDTCRDGTTISISFPGYKAVQGNGTTYDYRVDINKNNTTVALSHTNIITDIFNKITYGGMSATNLRDVLINLAIDGNINLQNIEVFLQYNPIVPSEQLITRVKKAHGEKTYNSDGNSFDLTLEELLKSIKWIVLQEDINYPISQNKQGRKMPFSRYLESIFITQTTPIIWKK